MSGLFTQSVCILTEKAPSLDDLEQALGDFEVLGRTEQDSEGHWAFGGPAVIVQVGYHPDHRVVIDVMEQKWRDDTGDPNEDPMLFGAWSMGMFGPFAHPGALERAGKQAWLWRAAAGAVRRHTAIVRVRASFAGEGDVAPLPEDYDSKRELLLVTCVAAAILQLPGSLAYFNPNGESLRPPEMVHEALVRQRDENVLPLEIWTNVRLARLDEESGWMMMDSVGMAQLGLPDVEVVFQDKRYEYEKVDEFIRTVVEYLLESGDVLQQDDVMDGPGDLNWTVHRFTNGLTTPPRATVRLIPEDGTTPPDFITERVEEQH